MSHTKYEIKQSIREAVFHCNELLREKNKKRVSHPTSQFFCGDIQMEKLNLQVQEDTETLHVLLNVPIFGVFSSMNKNLIDHREVVEAAYDFLNDHWDAGPNNIVMTPMYKFEDDRSFRDFSYTVKPFTSEGATDRKEKTISVDQNTFKNSVFCGIVEISGIVYIPSYGDYVYNVIHLPDVLLEMLLGIENIFYRNTLQK